MVNSKKSLSNNPKTIIGMCHLLPLPGDLHYDSEKGISYIIERAKYEINILQKNNISGILFSNEFSYPYSQKISQVTVVTMARIVGELKRYLTVPFGVDCMYDSSSTLDLTIATDADFYRITLPKIDYIDFEFGYTELNQIFRYNIITYTNKTPKLLLNITPSFKAESSFEKIDKLANNIITQIRPYAICTSIEYIDKLLSCDTIKANSQIVSVFCDGGCNITNIEKALNQSSGVIIGTAFKQDSNIFNRVNFQNTELIMNAVYKYTT